MNIPSELDKAQAELLEAGIGVSMNIDLKEYSWLRTGGTALMVITPPTVGLLATTVKILSNRGVPWKVVGETSNLMFLDGAQYTCLVCTKSLSAMTYDEKHSVIVAETGAMLPDLSRFALQRMIDGFHGFEGIPGTVGGAIFMNAGAYGSTMEQVVESVDVILPDGETRTIGKSDLDFSYRNSAFKSGKCAGTISRASFAAKPGDQKAISSRMEEIHANRHRHFDYVYPNLGSIFAGSVYRSLGNRDRVFKIASALFYLFNYRIRLFGRQTPINRKWLNDLAVKRFKIRFDNQPFSDKSLNVLINNNHHTDDLCDYIEQLRSLVGENVPIENEIVRPF